MGIGISTACLFLSLSLSAQFTLAGSATSQGNDCYILTPAINDEVGSLWSTNKVSLDKSFEIYADIYLGTRDANGADGMTFSLQSVNNTIGNSGEGMGMQGVTPSFFVEFDTWQNTNRNDPAYDHMAIFRDGVVDHGSANNLVNEVSILPANADAEDSTYHLLLLKWDADSQYFSVSVDCVPRLEYQGDIINNIFGGDPFVYWGFTAATGGAVNEHKFCFRYISFEDTDSNLICMGDTVPITTIPGTYFNWRPYHGLDDPTIQSPKAAPDSTTLYHVKIIDLCGNARWDTVFVKVRTPEFIITDTLSICDGDSVEVNNEYIKDPGLFNIDTLKAPDLCDSIIYQHYVEVLPLPEPIGFDSVFCPPDLVMLSPGDSLGSFVWSTGETSPSILVGDTGVFWVDVNRAGCIVRAYFHLAEGDDCFTPLIAPNVFSPNGDGFNDTYQFEEVRGIDYFELRIFNRWGSEVFASADITESWDGSFNGTPLGEGVYYYILKYSTQYELGRERQLHGSVTLLR